MRQGITSKGSYFAFSGSTSIMCMEEGFMRKSTTGKFLSDDWDNKLINAHEYLRMYITCIRPEPKPSIQMRTYMQKANKALRRHFLFSW